MTDHSQTTEPNREERLEAALNMALAVISDYLAYQHNGDPWEEDARLMGEMEINDYGRDGRMEQALNLLGGEAMTDQSQTTAGEPPAPSDDTTEMLAQALVGVFTLRGLADNPTLTVDAARYAMKGAAKMLAALAREARNSRSAESAE